MCHTENVSILSNRKINMNRSLDLESFYNEINKHRDEIINSRVFLQLDQID